MAQAIQLVEQVIPWYGPAVWLLICTGVRPAELCGLRVRDVDLVRRLVHIEHTFSPVQGFDGGRREYAEGPAKTDAGERSIPIPLWLCEDLAAVLAARQAAVGTQPAADEHPFLNKQRHPINRDTFRAKIIRPALRRAGLPETFRTYDFRHSHASQLIDDGDQSLAVAQRMGHADPAITLRVYGHLFEGVQEQLTERLEQRRRAAEAHVTWSAG